MAATTAAAGISGRPLLISSRRRSTAARRTVAAFPIRAASSLDTDASSRSSVSLDTFQPSRQQQLASRREALALPAAFAAAFVAISSPSPAAAAVPPALECAVELQTGASGLQFCDAVVGEGREPTKGTTIKANYTGRLADGRVFDSSYTRGKPLQFTIGVGQVIRGWDEGILGGEGIPPMKVGGKRLLVVPAKLGYGDRGAGGGLIPGGATLTFDVELVAAP
uniref:peptidylprolyl isomerase n=1 Tax=Mantoniella antarctica TaxID=81844 RepID=A0A7S0X6N8_9CHLO|mmetsp:Transcript_23583/g.58456  ORF Transcript_23583/g.58456 Transcript_23583/m.58456 type:complete len:223 (+) Transcript_23583:92-760(+)